MSITENAGSRGAASSDRASVRLHVQVAGASTGLQEHRHLRLCQPASADAAPWSASAAHNCDCWVGPQLSHAGHSGGVGLPFRSIEVTFPSYLHVQYQQAADKFMLFMVQAFAYVAMSPLLSQQCDTLDCKGRCTQQSFMTMLCKDLHMQLQPVATWQYSLRGSCES